MRCLLAVAGGAEHLRAYVNPALLAAFDVYHNDVMQALADDMLLSSYFVLSELEECRLSYLLDAAHDGYEQKGFLYLWQVHGHRHTHGFSRFFMFGVPSSTPRSFTL